jgi:hypothetical protein
MVEPDVPEVPRTAVGWGGLSRFRRIIQLALVLIPLLLAALAQNGLYPGGLLYYSIARNPFKPGPRDYFGASILHTTLAHLGGFTDTHLEAVLFVLAFGVFAIWCVGYVAAERISARWGYAFLALLVFHPITTTLLRFVVFPDSLTMLATVLVFFGMGPTAVFFGGVIGALSHASQMLVIVITALLCRVLLESDRRRAVAAAACTGWLVGKGLVVVYLHHFGIVIEENRLDWVFKRGPVEMARVAFRDPWAMLYTLHYAYWALLLVMIGYAARKQRRVIIALTLTQALAFTFIFATADTSRVHAILAWGPFVYCLILLLQDTTRHPSAAGRVLAGAVVAAILASAVAPKSTFFRRHEDLSKSRAHLHRIIDQRLGSSSLTGRLAARWLEEPDDAKAPENPGGAITVPLDRLSQPKLPGVRWNHPDNLLLAAEGVLVELGSPRTARRIEISHDGNDAYELAFRRRGSRVASQTLPRQRTRGTVPAPGEPRDGLVVVQVEVPKRAVDRGFDQILILPKGGDRKYAIGHLILSDEPADPPSEADPPP